MLKLFNKKVDYVLYRLFCCGTQLERKRLEKLRKRQELKKLRRHKYENTNYSNLTRQPQDFEVQVIQDQPKRPNLSSSKPKIFLETVNRAELDEICLEEQVDTENHKSALDYKSVPIILSPSLAQACENRVQDEIQKCNMPEHEIQERFEDGFHHEAKEEGTNFRMQVHETSLSISKITIDQHSETDTGRSQESLNFGSAQSRISGSVDLLPEDGLHEASDTYFTCSLYSGSSSETMNEDSLRDHYLIESEVSSIDTKSRGNSNADDEEDGQIVKNTKSKIGVSLNSEGTRNENDLDQKIESQRNWNDDMTSEGNLEETCSYNTSVDFKVQENHQPTSNKIDSRMENFQLAFQEETEDVTDVRVDYQAKMIKFWSGSNDDHIIGHGQFLNSSFADEETKGLEKNSFNSTDKFTNNKCMPDFINTTVSQSENFKALAYGIFGIVSSYNVTRLTSLLRPSTVMTPQLVDHSSITNSSQCLTNDFQEFSYRNESSLFNISKIKHDLLPEIQPEFSVLLMQEPVTSLNTTKEWSLNGSPLNNFALEIVKATYFPDLSTGLNKTNHNVTDLSTANVDGPVNHDVMIEPQQSQEGTMKKEPVEVTDKHQNDSKIIIDLSILPEEQGQKDHQAKLAVDNPSLWLVQGNHRNRIIETQPANEISDSNSTSSLDSIKSYTNLDSSFQHLSKSLDYQIKITPGKNYS